MLTRLLAPTLAATILATGAFGGTAVLADSGTTTAPSAAAPADHTHQRAIDALRDTLDRMVDAGVLARAQADAVVDAAKRSDWDGFSVERLGDILAPLVANGVITAKQRDTILDAVRHSDRVTFRLAATLDSLRDRGILSRDQVDAIRDALHRADWDGFSIERLGDILGRLVHSGVLTARERDLILDGVRR